MSTTSVRRHGDVAVLWLCREAKRNAIDDATILRIGEFFAAPPAWVKAVVLAAEGDHFSAGLDLSELTGRRTEEALEHSLMWHRVFQIIDAGNVPVVAALKGAVIGGGLELAATAHIRVAEPTAFYALPEGQRGLFVGGGGSVRIPRLIGAHRMADMMLTGRVYDAEEGQAIGLSNYLVDEGDGLTRALELAERIAANAPLTNFAVLQALPRIAEAAPAGGLLMESLMAAVAAGSDEAKGRMREFLEHRAAKVAR
ncbi:crotonase/enoyl-CoA hydratase family protein [Actinomadura barringtoniae]|uniref:Crotonase/enoyl-CoA hydratase family protein n=1 Tax=Actinomadura barringtoniae TaxID=1427535 RepID=A0A939PHB3_9ACTN|nr:crotonase/enoyl-CoA hydratase family protein [Actinomadura barringtoniae]MBO2452681.1 crotonase/enoyl-CoA hydratase family protein [Actinomadura barringtoniae]